MLRIGEAAKKFDISNRTLRYWEETGILKSTRTENGYRFYDGDNAARIRQIVLLRKLRMPVADIERMFTATEPGAAADALSEHLESLRRDAAVYGSLIVLVERLIRHIRGTRNPEQVFEFLEAHDITVPARKSAPRIQLSERIVFMPEKLNNVRIVKLPAMTVASYRAESAAPEDDCGKVFNKFVIGNNLHKRGGYRQFGFNNPSPTEGNPVYGYEMWVTVPDDFNAPAPFVKKRFGGGLYASVSTQMNEIGERWRMLYEWCKDNDKYDADSSCQWLEECTMDFETFISGHVPDSEKQLDLLHPIKLR